ncbi:MAG TPA: hypothetical protein VFT59_01320 [Candidatus Saccharimonadales bacterium]|nr:hypothetical protein [Candidatus Saccharimonadales bacterium]
MDGTLLAFMIGILIVGVLLIVVITLTKRSPVGLDVEKYRSRWLQVEGSLKRDEQSSYHLAILNADKLLDQALRDRGIKGETMGERMKTARGTWSNANAVWTAHKLRNQIAHETDIQISYDDTRRALAAFKQALRDVGAI